MTRPAIEVADIVRAKGSQFLERFNTTLSYQQLKAYRAVLRCRTAALGGHKDKPTPGELAKVLLLMQQLPSVVRFGLTSLAKAAATTLLPLPSGRPAAIPEEKCAEVLDFISSLNRNGYRLTVAKDRAAPRYGVSLTSIDRLWTRRGEYGGEDTSGKPTMESARQYFFTGKQLLPTASSMPG